MATDLRSVVLDLLAQGTKSTGNLRSQGGISGIALAVLLSQLVQDGTIKEAPSSGQWQLA